jgi:solute carrier family 25 aspartate/glutamate transporter 12/13
MIKTRLQSGQFTGPAHVVKTIMGTEGIGGFYKGLGANLVGVTPEKAIKLAANEYLREKLGEDEGPLPLHYEMLAGAGAGFVQCIATNPMEITKIRLQMQSMLPPDQRMGTMDVVKSLGLRGMYQGSEATLVRDVPFSLLFFPAYSNLKDLFANADGTNSKMSLLAAGCLAGGGAAGLNTPADVVKTRMQVAGGKERYGTMLNCFKTVFRDEGFMALYAGAVPRMCVVAPLFGIALLSFEKVKEIVIAREAAKA